MQTYSASKRVDLTKEEIENTVANAVKERLGMELDVFLKAYRGGTLEDPSAVSDLLMLLDLIERESCST